MTDEQRERNLRLADALESGKYEQGCAALKQAGRFCCLGVACDVSGLADWYQGSYLGETAYAPNPVIDYYGWEAGDPWILIQGITGHAATFNDNHCTFTEIAEGFRWLARQ